MKWNKLWIAGLAVSMALPAATMAREGARNYLIHNRLRLEYDDNIRETERDKTSSFKIIEEVEFLVNFNLENTFVSFRYKPSFVWWENRDESSTDLHHDFDFIFNHKFTPRLALGIKDTFRYAELPEAIERGTVVRQRSDFLYNALLGTLTYQVTPVGRMEMSGRYNLLRYDKFEIADVEDYDMYVAGLSYRHSIVPETSVSLESRFESISYDTVDRDADSYQVGVGTEHMFSPNVLGNARIGYHYKDYSADSVSSDSAPYAELNMTLVPSPATRISFGIGHSMLESDIFPYANQDRTRLFVGVAYDVTARVSWNIAGSYIYSKYDADDAVVELADAEGVEFGDGSEDIIQLSTRVTYRVNRSNWLEAGWQFTTLDSDLRQDFDRNRVSIGWKTQL